MQVPARFIVNVILYRYCVDVCEEEQLDAQSFEP